jgi:hypothetical protein
MQGIPTPRYVETPIQIPEFTDVSVAENFLAKLATLVAGSELDIQTGLELSELTRNWIESKNRARELELKTITIDGPGEQIIKIEGGLPVLPGCENLIMPQLNGHGSNGHALAAPEPAVPTIESSATDSVPAAPPGSTNGNAQDP